MHSSIVAALLAVAPLAAAHAVQVGHFEEIKIRQVSSAAAASTTDYSAILSECIPPSTLYGAYPTNAPTPPADIESFFATLSVTDVCAAETVAIPGSISADFHSYSSAIYSWYSVNGPIISSIDAALSSFEASASANPVCASFIQPVTATDTGLGICTSVTTGKAGGTTASASHSGSNTGSGSATASSAGSTASTSSSSGTSKSAADSLLVPRDNTVFLLGTLVAAYVAAMALL